MSAPDQQPDQQVGLQPQTGHPERMERPEPPRRVTVRRSPRYAVFVVGGIMVGAVVALGLTFSEPPSQYGYPATLGYLVVALGAVGALVGGLAAVVAGLVLDRQQAREQVREQARQQAREQGPQRDR